MGDRAQFIAGAWCLDFANTVEPRTGDGRDYLPDYDALIQWSRQAGLLKGKEADALRRRTTAAEASDAHRRAIQVREATYRVFHTAATGQQPDARDLTTLRDAQAEATAHATPQWDNGLHWTWPIDADRPRWMLADNAVRLLQSARINRVKVCRPSCGWLFLDHTRNTSRRWCSPTDCGLREKIRRQAERRAIRHNPNPPPGKPATSRT